MTEFLARRAISCTAAKSPSEAIGKPASMMSTPMSSSSSATSSFSSWVMVAPGHCSPSRKVVSKMTTRSLSDWVWEVMALILLVECAAHGRVSGVLITSIPRVPRRKRPAGPQGRIRRRSVPRMREATEPACGRPFDRADGLPRRHCLGNPRFRPPGWRKLVKSALTLVYEVLLADRGRATQGCKSKGANARVHEQGCK